MTIRPPIPEIQFDLENSRSQAKVKSTPVSAASWLLISLMFHIRASYRLLSPSFHDIWASHSRDTIWPWQFKVKGQGQRYPSQRSIQMTHFLGVSHQGILSTPVPFVPWQTGLPFQRYNLTLKFKVKGQGQRYPSQRTIQLTHFLFVWHQLDQPFPRYGKYDVRLQKTDLKFYAKNFGRISPAFNQVESMIRGIYLPRFVVIG